jgi:hypothetical protein
LGNNQGGTVFELTPGENGQWTQNTLVGFEGEGSLEGDEPSGSLTFDSAGNLYGSTWYGGTDDVGVIFELMPQQNGQWTESVLYNFTGGADGDVPNDGLVFDASGNLFGTTRGGGNDRACDYGGCGVVFELSPASGNWTETTLYTFCSQRKCGDGAIPAASVIFDVKGNLYGTTLKDSGCPSIYAVCGTVFRLAPNPKGGWAERVIHRFILLSSDGFGPEAGVIFDSMGHMYGTTEYGGDTNAKTCPTGESGCGVVFEMIP